MSLATSQRQLRRADWFRRGVHAIGCVVSTPPSDAYLCPLCLSFFTKEQLIAGVLTDEHGGRWAACAHVQIVQHVGRRSG
jgi:hypothetical protein